MGVYSDVTGYLLVGATPNEFDEVQKIMDFNRAAIEEMHDTDLWQPNHFRLTTDRSSIRTFQSISIYMHHNNRIKLDEFQETMYASFKRLVWSDGFVADRSIDRAIIGEPLAYEYEFRNTSYRLNQIQAVGDDFEVEIKVRPWNDSR